jgi:hypothetical protein
MALPSLKAKQGDTIDFIVDFGANLNSDMFQWAPVISATSAMPVAEPSQMTTWDAQKEFGGSATPSIAPLNPWEQLVQVFLLTNEFSFAD